MELAGKIVKRLPVVSGESTRGPWKKQDFIIETSEQYPKKVCVTCWGDKVEELDKLSDGQDVRVSINIESREYNERWYTDVKAWKIDVMGAGQSAPPPAQNSPAPVMDEGSDDDSDDLPF
jgi:hypothetical protein